MNSVSCKKKYFLIYFISFALYCYNSVSTPFTDANVRTQGVLVFNDRFMQLTLTDWLISLSHSVQLTMVFGKTVWPGYCYNMHMPRLVWSHNWLSLVIRNHDSGEKRADLMVKSIKHIPCSQQNQTQLPKKKILKLGARIW